MTRKLLTTIGMVVGGGVALALAWFLLSPLFITRAVDEAFPASAPAAVATEAGATDEMEPEAATPPPAATATPAEATAEPDVVMAEPMAEEMATMTVLASGSFYPIAHAGEGSATIYQLADGSRLLRFENLKVDNGPDLHVWLVPVDPVPDSVGVEIPGYVDLGKLKGNVGNQNYEIPADLDLSAFQSVVIWCQPFRVPFTAAPLRLAMSEAAPESEPTAPPVAVAQPTAPPPTETLAPTASPVPPTAVPPTVTLAPTATEVPVPPATPAPPLPDLGEAPEISNDVWINADAPIRLADLRGKVVVVEFWTFDCYNCQNVLPYIKQWHQTYRGEDFEVVSIHYPEFNHEKEYANVLAAVQRFGIEYPVALDNEGTTWRAYRQRYWPTWYVLDQAGHIRYKHIGEGGYEETEAVIRQLLAQGGGR